MSELSKNQSVTDVATESCDEKKVVGQRASEVMRMESQEVEHFLHGQGIRPLVVKASRGEKLRDVLTRTEVFRNGQDGIFVFVGECEEALSEPREIDDGADQQRPVDIDLTLEVLEIHRHRHVHVHHCRHIAVEVNFGGKTKQHRFSPATTVGVVTEWARKKFSDLDPAAIAEYVLEICGTTTQPRSNEHLGELVRTTTCSICFNLVKEVTPQG
jgi:hypothetical protein